MVDLPTSADVVIVGSGIAGVTTAYYLVRQNVNVLLVDRSALASEASGGNAGMIGESGGDPATTMVLQRQSVALYKEAADAFDDDFELVMDGRLRLAITPEDVTTFESLVTRQRAAGIEGHMLYGADVQRFEPVLSGKVRAAAWFPGDGKLHPAKATSAFYHAAIAHGCRSVNGVNVTDLKVTNGRVSGVSTTQGDILADQVVLATGAWTAALAVTGGFSVPVFPGKGHMLATEPLPQLTNRVLRAERLGARQFANGEVLLGSEVELAGYDKTVNRETIDSYLRFMQELIPDLREAKVGRAWGCLRPMSIDSLPIIGAVPKVAGLYLITGHGRSGMGLAPASARGLADMLLTSSATSDLAPYAPGRFADA